MATTMCAQRISRFSHSPAKTSKIQLPKSASRSVGRGRQGARTLPFARKNYARVKSPGIIHPHGHSGALAKASEPGIQTQTPSSQLDSGLAPFGAPRNDDASLRNQNGRSRGVAAFQILVRLRGVL